MFFEWANDVISFIGKIAPVTFDKWVTAIILVFLLIFFSISSKESISPSYLDEINTDVSGSSVEMAGDLAAKASQPIGDHRGSEEYKRSVVKTLTTRAIMKAKNRALGGN